MKRLLPWASYLIFIPLMLFVTVACGSLSLLVSLWDKSGRQQHAIAQLWAKLMLGIALSPMKVVNPQNLHLGRAAVFASNHLSYMDTPALFGSLPFQFRILANHYLFKIPFIGWHLTRSGQVPIDQSSMRSMVAGLMRGVATLKSGMPLLIFPDGGRSSDGHIHQFLQGAAFMAIKAQVPLVPLALVGTYELLPMHTYHLAPRPLMLVACDPIETTGMTTKDAEALTNRLMDAIAVEYYRHSKLVQPESVPENQAKIPSSQL
ncbi:lysophospholipid acyltransferase family protein [Terriglobus roseus]|uniref:1-acyl-sn-glycerol-3-phosphate acyltransferase n=1 Tax=Terriglobus roseus TaxID=392734 RepID=A0A1G7PKQ5_9BACT|nr:lysophospholipid acyltransferase family protein [Terriglobus roseus]SDF86813.1 1-acyl-sn-glycerol-3-phosphate acyltransferase [Terriglobus roseus]